MDDEGRGTTSSASVTVALWVLATIASLLFLRFAAALLIPIAIGVLVSYALEPVVAWLARHRVPRLAGTSLVLLSLTISAAWGTYRLRDEINDAIATLPEAARRAREMLTRQTQSGPGASLREAADEIQRASDPSPADGRSPQAPKQEASLPGPSANVAGLAQQGLSSVMTLAGNLLVVFFLVFFLLASGHHVRHRLVEIAGPALERRRLTNVVIDEINSQIQRFLLVRLVTSVVVGAATWAVLAWMGVANAAVWGTLAGVFNSIPYFGPVIVSGGLLVVGLAQGTGMPQAAQMAGAALVITSLEGWLLTPPLMGKAERMSALAVFLGVLLWTWIWGGWGTILAVPMLVVLKSVADHVDPLRPVGRLMAP